MKKLSLVLLLILFTAVVCSAKTVNLSWDPSPSTVTGYKVHYSTSQTEPFPVVLDVGNVLEATIVDLPDKTGYHFAVSAYDSLGFESVYSNVVFSPGFAPPEAPAGLSGVTRINNVSIPMD